MRAEESFDIHTIHQSSNYSKQINLHMAPSLGILILSLVLLAAQLSLIYVIGICLAIAALASLLVVLQPWFLPYP